MDRPALAGEALNGYKDELSGLPLVLARSCGNDTLVTVFRLSMEWSNNEREQEQNADLQITLYKGVYNRSYPDDSRGLYRKLMKRRESPAICII